jgi:hypothetical protein
MWLISVCDFLGIAAIVGMAWAYGLEQALPVATFELVLFSQDAVIPMTGFFNLTPQRIILVVLIMLYAFRPQRAKQISVLTKWLLPLIVVHVAWCAVSTANSVVVVASMKKMTSEILEYYYLFYIFCRTIQHVETLRRILFGIVLGVAVASVFGAIEAYTGWSIMDCFPPVTHRFDWDTTMDTADRGIRVHSTFPHAILFGAALVMGITLAIYLLTRARDRSTKSFLWLCLALMFLNIYKTGSRGPWIAAALSLAIFLVVGSMRMRKYVVFLAILAVSVMVIRPGVYDSIVAIYRGTFDSNTVIGSSYEYRFALSSVAIHALSHDFGRAAWGYGLESFYFLGLEGELNRKAHRFLSADSAWIELMIETGYIGLLIIGSILFLPAWYAWKDFCYPAASDPFLSLCLLVNMLAFYFMMLSVGMYGWGQNGYMLWIMIAESVAYRSFRKRKATVADSLLLGTPHGEVALA